MLATCALTIAMTLLVAAGSAAPAVANGGTAAPVAASTTPATPVASKARTRTVLSVLTRRTHVRAGRTARIAGRVRPAASGRLVVLQRRAHRRWVTIDRARTRSGGRYTLRYRTRDAISAALRVRVAGGRHVTGRTRGVGRLEAFRSALASWYGEGQALACGGHLTPGMMGVAHKSLPCGTKITIRYHGRQVRVRVVDRGPYSGGREFDLGPGVRSALHFDGVGTVQVAY
jgi:rare lipoprotein A (peptidoglycan hydrolase)